MPRIKYKRPDEMSTYDLAKHIGKSRSTVLYLLAEGIIPEPPRKGNKRVWTAKQADEIKRMVENADAGYMRCKNGGNA